MIEQSDHWKKGRGKLGVLEPLLGTWSAVSDSPMGKVKCTRKFEKVLGGNFIQLTAQWEIGEKKYDEIALFGMDENLLSFWSFTSDGKMSVGRLQDGSDVHPSAICFEAEMPAGIARMIYWPDDTGEFYWAVESKNKKGWKRFTEHHYKLLK